jgi:divalent metal cation (Fe/Co/Zn/Cd) transporter
MKKIKSNLIMFLIFVAYLAITTLIFAKTYPDNKVALLVGIILSFIYSITCFFNKRVRSKWTVWWGILSLLSCGWWIYLMTE